MRRWLRMGSVLRGVFSLVLASAMFNPEMAAASGEFYLERTCQSNDERMRSLLQYLYKIDGNLRELNESKVKRIKFLESNLRKTRDRAQYSISFRELYNDPDWYQYKIQSEARGLISKVEEAAKTRSWNDFKARVEEQLSDIGTNSINYKISSSATGVMQSYIRLGQEIRGFFKTLEDSEQRLSELGEWSRLSRSLEESKETRTVISGLFLLDPDNILNCQVEYIGFALSKAKRSK
jgi:hypothetical protein